MLKRILAGLLALSMLFLTACKSSSDETKEWLMSELELESEPTTDTEIPESSDEPVLMGDTESEDPLRICIDLVNIMTDNSAWIDQALEDFLFRLKETVGLENVVLEIIPSQFDGMKVKTDYTARSSAIERIQSEILDGKGPDVFILTYELNIDYMTASVDYDMTNSVFDYPQKAMEYGYFLPLDELIENNTELTEWDKLTQPVLEAGRNWEGQQIIPLSYTLPIMCYPKAEWEHIPDKEYTWGDMLHHSALLPHSLDMANCINARFGGDPWPDTAYIEYIMGEYADFENEELGFTEEELLECVKDIISLEPRDNYEEFDDARETYVGVELSERTLNKPMTFLPIYNVDGGVTAHIGNYAAINRNTEKPEEAFKVIDLLMSKYVQRWGNIYNDLLCSYDSIPLHEDLFQKSDPLVGNNYYMRQDNYEAFCKVREQITCANFESEGTHMLSDVLSLCMNAESLELEQKTVEEAVHEAYEEMQRRLKE